MFLPLLTVILYLTRANELDYFEETTTSENFENVTLYNIYEYIKELHLERCSFVAIGLKYFAIFIEDGFVNDTETNLHNKFFLGICQQKTLEEWTFCASSLAKKKKYKCKFKLGSNKYHSRVHRRFCDIKVMVNNKDCICDSTIFGDNMLKVKGFPTCFIPPLPNSLCKYNVCGLSKCKASTVENRLHTVQCDSSCTKQRPYCEKSLQRTSLSPISKSYWSKWRLVETSESPEGKKQRSLASCINLETNKGDVDCLGPSTGCFVTNLTNSSCNTFEEDGALQVEKIMYISSKTYRIKSIEKYETTTLPHKISARQCPRAFKSSETHHSIKRKRNAYSYLRDNDEDVEDDDENDDQDINEDIVFEESVLGKDSTVTTTEEPERDESKMEMMKEVIKEVNGTSNVTEVPKQRNDGVSWKINSFILVVVLSVILEINYSFS